MNTACFKTAAFEAHTRASEMLRDELGRSVSPAETASALAIAFGQAMAMAELEAAYDGEALVSGINALAQDAYEEVLNCIVTRLQQGAK